MSEVEYDCQNGAGKKWLPGCRNVDCLVNLSGFIFGAGEASSQLTARADLSGSTTGDEPACCRYKLIKSNMRTALMRAVPIRILLSHFK